VNLETSHVCQDSFRSAPLSFSVGLSKLSSILSRACLSSTGAPFSVLIRGDQANTGTVQQDLERPNFAPGPSCSTNAINSGNPSNYINLQCFSFPNLGELGNLGPNTLRGPGLVDFDPSVAKTWGFESGKNETAIPRGIFNILNRSNFFEPSAEIFDGSGNLEPAGAQLGAMNWIIGRLCRLRDSPSACHIPPALTANRSSLLRRSWTAPS
jgi:hypothetical protein